MDINIEITITKLPNNILEVKETKIYIENSEELTRKNRRYCISPIDDYSDKPQEVKDMCDFVFTNEAKQSYKDSLPKEIANDDNT